MDFEVIARIVETNLLLSDVRYAARKPKHGKGSVTNAEDRNLKSAVPAIEYFLPISSRSDLMDMDVTVFQEQSVRNVAQPLHENTEGILTQRVESGTNPLKREVIKRTMEMRIHGGPESENLVWMIQTMKS